MSSLKTEPATPRRLRKERQKGNVAQSRDLTSTLILSGLVGTLCASIDGTVPRIADFSRKTIATAAGNTGSGRESVLDLLGEGWTLLGELLLPFLLTAAAFAILGPLCQIGPLLALDPLKPKLERLDPVQGLRNRLLGPQPFLQLTTALLKIGLAAFVCFYTLRGCWNELLSLYAAPPVSASTFVASIVVDLAVNVILLFAAVSVLDVSFQRWLHRRRLRMSKDEIRREYRETEGSPEAKAGRQRLQDEILQEASVGRVPEADFVSINPTEIACAVRYDPARDGAPRLIAKGRGLVARRIRELARHGDVPIVRDVPFARALFELPLETEIPEELHVAAVAILHWVEKRRRAEGKSVRWRREEEEPRDEKEPTIDWTS